MGSAWRRNRGISTTFGLARPCRRLGAHHTKFGYDGGCFSQFRHNTVNDSRQTYRYDWPAATCAATASCGNNLYFPSNPTNTPLGPDGVGGTLDDGRRPVPSRVTINTGLGEVGTRVMYAPSISRISGRSSG